MLDKKERHYLFLEEELQAQTNAFNAKLNTSAYYLLSEREELFVAKFVGFKDGEMILKFSMKSALPRKGEYLYCFTTPKEFHNYRNWGNKTYGDLLMSKGFGSEVIYIWQSAIIEEPGFCLAGFRGVDTEFMEHIQYSNGAILILGPNIPPYEYLSNLQKIIRSSDFDIRDSSEMKTEIKNPIILKSETNISDFLIKQLSLSDSLILMGPPGTGKTTEIAELCKSICEQGKSVLVTALTNRALMEVAHKKSLAGLLESGHIHKTKITIDEAQELPLLNLMKSISVIPGGLVLSTYYITSGLATQVEGEPPFDYVIMDEASQAITAMFCAVRKLGKKTILVGDINQLPPVTMVNKDRVEKMCYNSFIFGLKEISSSDSAPTYMLSETWRLPERAAQYTGCFYAGKLHSKVKETVSLKPIGIEPWIDQVLSDRGGPTLVMTDMNLGDRKPISGISIATAMTLSLLSADKNLKIAVLTFFVETAKALQRYIYSRIPSADRLIIDTVSRIQGLTTDVVIYLIPNTGYLWSISRGLFNVATSRATKHTIIISDKGVIDYALEADKSVRDYLLNLHDEMSTYIPFNKDNLSMTMIDCLCLIE